MQFKGYSKCLQMQTIKNFHITQGSVNCKFPESGGEGCANQDCFFTKQTRNEVLSKILVSAKQTLNLFLYVIRCQYEISY